MTRRRSSPLGLELVMSVVLALVVLPLLSHGAPVQESHDLQKYSEGCYYNYNHYSEGDRILTNEPCLNCTCHNRMLMCYLRVCPFTKPIGHDCTVEKREDQCCPIVTCPEVPVDIAHHSHQLTTSSPGTELSIPEKYGCSIDNKFYSEGAQVPSNPNKPCELCYCIRNRTSCLMQECTLHIDGCQPIYNKGSCCPVRYNCDHENELLEIEDFSTTTTTVRPTQGYLLPSTTSPAVTTDCFHENEVYADGASITGKSSCEHCYCMRGDIVCAVQECEMPTLESGAKTCHALPPAAGECCPSNYVCDDDSVTTDGALIEDNMLTTILPMIQSNLHESVSQEDVQLQEHIDDKIAVTEVPDKSVEHSVQDDSKEEIIPATISPIAGEVEQPSEEDVKDSEETEEEKPLFTTMSAIKETRYETTQSPIEHSTTHKTEDALEDSHHDKVDESTHAPIEEDIINEDKEEDAIEKLTTTVSPVVGDILKVEDEDEEKPSKIPAASPVEETTAHSILEEEKKGGEDQVPLKEEDIKSDEAVTTSKLPEAESDVASTTSSSKPDIESEPISSTPSAPVEEPEDVEKTQPTEAAPETTSEISAVVTLAPSKTHIEPETSTTAQEETSSESVEFSEETPVSTVELQDKIDEDVSVPSTESSTKSPIYEMITEGDDSHIGMPEIGDHKTESSLPKKKPKDEPESVETLPTASDETKDELPQIITDSTTVHSENDEGVTVTLKPLAPLDAVTPHAEKEVPTEVDESEENETSKPSITKDESTSDESTQATIEDIQKPVQENDEIPALVQEVTEVPSKPVSGDISQEEDISGETTAIPAKDASIDEITESQEKEDDVHPTESSYTDKRTTTSRPIRIHIAEEEYSTEIPSEGVEKDHIDSTTYVPSIADAIAVVTEKHGEDSDVPIDHTSAAPSIVKSDEVEIKGEQDATTIAPSTSDSELSSTEKEQVKPEKEILTEASSTPSSSEEEEIVKEDIDLSTPSVTDLDEPKKELEQDVSDSTTNIPSITETGTPKSKEEELKGKPQHGTDDSTTSIPTVDESVEPHEEGEQDKIQPAHGIDEVSASTPSATDSEEEEHTKPTDHSTSYSTTEHPSIAIDKETSTEEDELKGKPQYDSTEIPAVVESETTNIKGDDVTQQPEVVITDSTTSSSQSKPEAASSEQDVPATADSGNESTEEGDVKQTTATPIVSDSVSPLFVEEEKLELRPTVSSVYEPESTEKGDVKETTVTPTVSDYVSPLFVEEEELELSPTVSSVDEPEVTQKQDDKKHMEQETADSTTIVPSIPESETEIPEEEQKEKPSISEHETPASEEDIKQQPEPTDSTTIVPSIVGSDEEVKEESENALGDSTTASPSADSEKEIDEEVIKKQPDQGIVDSSTKSSVAIPSETSTIGGEQDKELKPTTISPSIADSETSIPEEEKVNEKPELNADDLTTKASSAADADKSSQTTSATVSGDDQEIIVSSTSKPYSIDSYETSTEIDQSKQPIDKDDVLRTTLSPNAFPDKESTDISEGTGVPLHDIIPSAIPGEGDCLANGKTFANNATVPISNECEISCSCISSIVVCQRVQCNDPPQPNNCVLDEASTDKCCPEYICGIDSFADDKRPTTPEDIEDEEIQFTTLAPAKKYPEISTEAAISTQQPDEALTIIYAEKPIYGDESTKTEQPEIPDERTTPSSIDIELPIVTPEDPMSHIKDDKVQEESTEHSEEDFAVESSTTTKQPITTKPTKQVTGDIELPIEFTSVPEVNVPTKKPEGSTTLGASDDEEEEKATATPTIHEVSPAAEIVTESGKPISSKDEIATKSPISMDVSETDESIPTTEGTAFEREFTTLQAVHTETSSKAPSVIDRDDSAQSEETSETSDEGSNESGEETDSEEDTKSPMLQKEEDQKITTSRPIVSEHAGDIEPEDESTTIPEIDYQKPEILEDLSHTMVEEKPVKPIGVVESGESEESEEVTDKTETTPASTILPHIEPAKEDSNKVDDIPSSESDEDKKSDESIEHIPPHEETQISSTASPNKSEEDLHSVTATEQKKDEIATQTGSPSTVSVDESDLEKNKIPIESSTPASDEEKLIVPAKDDKSSESKEGAKSSTIAPAIDEQTIEGSGADTVEKESDDKKLYDVGSTSAPTTDRTLAPVSSDESIEEKDDISSQTIAPAADDHTVKDSGTTSTAGESDISPTSAPTIDELTEGSGAQSSEEEDEIISDTSAPSIDKQSTVSVSDEEDKIDATISPANEEHSVEGSGAPVSEDQANVQENEIISQTSAPTFVNQPTVSNVEGDKSDVTVSPTVEEHPVEGSGAPISEEKYDGQKNKPEIPASTPTIKEDSVEVTVAPVIEDDSKTIAPSIAASGTDSEEDISSQTSAPSVNVEPTPSTPSAEEDKSDEEKAEIDNQTAAPVHDFEIETEVSTEEKAHDSTSAPKVGEEIDSVTVVPITGDKYEETDLPEDKKPTVSVPTSEEENELDATTVSTEIKDKELPVEKTTEGSIPTKDIESSEESVDTTETPSKVTSAQELEDESAGATESIATSTPVKIMETEEDETRPTVVPIRTISEDESLDSTELPSSSTSAKPADSFDKDLEATESPKVDLDEDNISLATHAPTISESSSVDSEPASAVTMATPKLDEEILSQTQISVSADDHSSGEGLPTELPDTDVQEQHVDKTLLTTEISLPAEETATSSGSDSEKLDSEENLGQVTTVKPSAQTEKPATLEEETSTEEKKDSDSTDSTLMPEIISSHEVTPQPGRPESDDQILIEEMLTAKPSAEDVPAQTESPADKKKPSLEESNITTNTPIVFDKAEADEQPNKTLSVDKESAEDIDRKTPKPTAQTESPVSISSEEEVSSENDKPVEIKPVAQTETPSSILPDEEIPSKVARPNETISSETEQPISLDESTKPVSADEDVTITTGKPAEDASSSEPEEEVGDKVSLTVAPVEKQPVTPFTVDIHADFEHTSTEESDEEEELTKAPKDDTKVQTIAEFVTERMEDLTTVLPTKDADTDKETIPQQPISPISEESTTISSEEEEREKPEVPITTENVSPMTSTEKSEEKMPAPEIQPTISTEESEEQTRAPVISSEDIEQSDEKTQAPESSSETSEEDHKHEVKPTILPEDTEDKTQIPETQSAVAEEDQKKQVQPTEGSLPQSTSDKPIEPSAGDKIDTDLPKPIAEDDSPLLTTISPLLPNIEDKYTTSLPEFNASIAPSVNLSKPIVSYEQPIAEDDSLPITTINPLFPNIEDKHTTSRPEFNASIAPSVHDKINENLPKPMVTDDQPISEEESPLSTTIHPLFPHIEHDRTTSPPQLNATDKIDDKITESVAHPSDASPSSSIPTESPTTSQSITNAPTSHYQPPGYGQVPPQYPSYAEDEYTDEDETEVFGPGTCRYGGKLFVSAQQIPRDDPCDFCFCFRSDIICLQQSCPPPISGCHEEPISGFCCPRYECPVSMATTLNITTSTTTTSTTLPPHFLHHAYRGAAAKNGCHISGKSYKVGDKIDSASGPCMHCTCGGDGQMKCDPKTCSPEPMLRQMIAVVASRRR